MMNARQSSQSKWMEMDQAKGENREKPGNGGQAGKAGAWHVDEAESEAS